MKMLSKPFKSAAAPYMPAALIAIELLMSFSFLGYVHIEPISITVAYIPVLLAGALLGVPEAVILGMVFGLSSMWKADANYVLPFDQLFSPFRSWHPAQSLLLSIGSRMLFGLIIGVLYMLAKKLRGVDFWIFLVSFFGSFFHSLLVYGFIGILFPETGYGVANAIQGLSDPSDIKANIFTAVIVTLIWRIEQSNFWQELCAKVKKAQHLEQGGKFRWLPLTVITLLTVCFSMAVAVYFVSRRNYVLNNGGVTLTKANYSDLMHLQLQFLIGILSMTAFVITAIIFYRKYAAFVNYEAKTDSLTGVLPRKVFFQACGKVMGGISFDSGNSAYFIMIDVDKFKEINDRYGR